MRVLKEDHFLGAEDRKVVKYDHVRYTLRCILDGYNRRALGRPLLTDCLSTSSRRAKWNFLVSIRRKTHMIRRMERVSI